VREDEPRRHQRQSLELGVLIIAVTNSMNQRLLSWGTHQSCRDIGQVPPMGFSAQSILSSSIRNRTLPPHHVIKVYSSLNGICFSQSHTIESCVLNDIVYESSSPGLFGSGQTIIHLHIGTDQFATPGEDNTPCASCFVLCLYFALQTLPTALVHDILHNTSANIHTRIHA
jgi:hypothetical protein